MTQEKVRLVGVAKEFDAQQKDGRVRAVDGISFEIFDGEFFALLGPSGCGKTTTLRLIAGFEQPTAGEIWIDSQPMQGIPAFQRPVNTVFQDYVLFPHMSVLQNVMFGLQMAHVPKKEAEKRAHHALELVRLPKVATRKPSELSGGQQQRVALARAIVNRPAVLLLDEPLGALDLKLRREMQEELKSLQREVGITFVYVTHDQEEALTMADRIAVMSEGRVLQIGTPSDIYETPKNRFVADFIGETNFIPVQILSVEGKTVQVALDAEQSVRVLITEANVLASATPTLAIRPERIQLKLYNAPIENEQTAQVQGQVTQVQYLGTDTRYTVRIGESFLRVRMQNTQFKRGFAFEEGEHVSLSWDLQNARLLAD